jgi:hypothetical protein
MPSAIGSSEIDFGLFPGSNEASITVTGQTAITNVASIEAWIMADDTTIDHTTNDHRYFSALVGLTCGTPTSGQGFTIYARSIEKLTGTFKVRWVWSTGD